jgi:hypothetical protein
MSLIVGDAGVQVTIRKAGAGGDGRPAARRFA